MSWRAYVFDTITGLIRCPIDIPSFSWSMSISDSTLATTRDKNVGAEEATGLKLPWGAVPASNARERARLLSQDRRSIMLCWHTPWDGNSIGTPLIGGAITPRTDTAADTSFTLESPLGILSNRYLVDTGKFGKDANGTTRNVISYRNLSRRGLAAEYGARVTGGKHGGKLPIDWNYQGETGHENRDYHGYDIQNLDFKSFLTRLTNLENGPDCTFRPKLSDDTHFRWDFLAGTDGDVFIGQNHVTSFSYSPRGGSIEDITVDHSGPIHRRYVTGSGTGDGMKCAMAEDLTLVLQSDPWPLREMADSDNDINDVSLLRRAANGLLAGQSMPIMQIRGAIHANDVDQAGIPLHPLGSFWPGEEITLDIHSFPTLEDGRYKTRLMSMRGDETDKVTLTFDIMDDPIVF